MTWSASQKVSFICVAERPENSVMESHILFFKKDKKSIIFFDGKENQFFNGMYSTTDVGGDLITYWMSASAHRIIIYRYLDNKIEDVLKVGSLRPIEMGLYKKKTAFLVTDTFGRPWTTKIYGWSPEGYRLVSTRAFGNRFSILDK